MFFIIEPFIGIVVTTLARKSHIPLHYTLFYILFGYFFATNVADNLLP